MLNLQISDDLIDEMVDAKIKEILKSYKRTLVTVDMKDLVKMTGLSQSTLEQKIICEPEIIDVTRRIGTRVLYKYPEIINALDKVIDRLGR